MHDNCWGLALAHEIIGGAAPYSERMGRTAVMDCVLRSVGGGYGRDGVALMGWLGHVGGVVWGGLWMEEEGVMCCFLMRGFLVR